MAEKIKYSYKELKKPDKIRAALSRGLENASRHFNKILIATVALIAVFVLAYMFTSGGKKKDLAASKEFDTALQTYNEGSPLEAIDILKGLNEKYPGRNISKLGLYYAGIINYEIEKYDESIENLKAFTQTGLDDENINDSAYLTLGLASFNKESWDEAIDYFAKVDDEASPYFQQAKLHEGLSYEKKGDFEKSKEIFNNVLENQRSRAGNRIPKVTTQQ